MKIVYAKFCGENQMHCGLYESRWYLVLQSTPTRVNEVVMEWQGILQLLQPLIEYTFTFGLYVRLTKKTFHHLKKLHTKLLLNKS